MINRFLLTAALPWTMAGAQDLRIEHVTVVSPERATARRDATVSIHNGRIVASVNTTNVIDGRGLYLSPGLIDSHVHLNNIPGMTDEQEQGHPDVARAAREQIPKSYLYAGFTTLIDLISAPQAMARWKSHAIVPDTYFCGGAAYKDGYPMNFFPKPLRYELFPYMITDDSSAVAAVAHMKADGAICVKTFYEHGFGASHDLPVPPLAVIRTLVRAAHRAGLPVLIHANGTDAQRFALAAGVDIMAHGLWHWNEAPKATELTPSVQALLDSIIQANVGWQPTIQVLPGERDLFVASYLSNPTLRRFLPASLIDWYQSKEGQWFHDQMTQGDPMTEAQARAEYAGWIQRDEVATRYLAHHHARLLFGTDTPSAPTYANPPGLNGWMEMQNLVEAGMTPAQIFYAATLANAQAVHLDKEIGTVEVGKRANLLLLREDPTQTIHAYTGIVKVILRGRVLDPTDLAVK
jgi:imidazolonepropionase-like amidohydrolase